MSPRWLPKTLFLLLAAPIAFAAKPDITANDLPNPYNLQAAVLNQSVTLTWAWEPPNPGPTFQTFGYEVFRDTGIVAVVPKTAFTDFRVPVGSHSYKVRVT